MVHNPGDLILSMSLCVQWNADQSGQHSRHISRQIRWIFTQDDRQQYTSVVK